MKRKKETLCLAMVSLAVALGLGACSVGVESDGEQRTESASSSNPASNASEAVETPATPGMTEEDPDAGTATDLHGQSDGESVMGGAAGAMRDELSAGVVTELTCPNGVVDVTALATVVEVVEHCDVVNVSGDASTVIAATVGTLNVEASATVVLVASAEQVNLAASGSANTVMWESGSPVVNDLSTGSVVVPEERMP